MQLINQIASNATFGRLLLGAIPASGSLDSIKQAMVNHPGTLYNNKRGIKIFWNTADLGLSILSTVSFISLPLTTEKKALFWVVSALLLAGPSVNSCIQYSRKRSPKFKENSGKIYCLSLLITKLWTIIMFSVAGGAYCFGKNQAAFAAAVGGGIMSSLVYLRKDEIKSLAETIGIIEKPE